MSRLRILIVDDELVAAKIMNSYLKSFGECEVVTSGEEAVTCFEALLQETGKPYDLVCLDINMPVMDGHTVLKKIREMEEEYDIVPSDSARVIMTTLMNDAKNMSDAFMNRCEIYMVKPIRKVDLVQQLANLGIAENQA